MGFLTVLCETVTVGTRPARPSTLSTPSCSIVRAGSTVMAMGVDWISAAPVFVAVTVVRSANEDTARTRCQASPNRTSTSTSVALRLEPAESLP